MSAPLHLLRGLAEGDVIEAFDAQVAGVMIRRGGDGGEVALAVALGAAFTSRACREGHSAITIDELCSQSREARERSTSVIPLDLPCESEPWWVQSLGSSACVSDGGAAAPLVLRDGQLQFWRHYEAEGRIASRVKELLGTGVNGKAFAIVTGGPGTGKTTSIARMLTETSEADADHVALAAPTGKAADRLNETLHQRLDEATGGSSERFANLGNAVTLHRLLGLSPHDGAFRRNEATPLAQDLVIVDEASMVDVLMMDALMRAMKPGARLVLVGDQHQLVSVDAGDVLGALCRAASDAGPASPLGRCVTWLERSWRFEERPGIGNLAKAVLQGDAAGVEAACSDPSAPYVQRCAPPADADALVRPIIPYLERCLKSESPAALLDVLGAFRLLAPEREGRLGVARMNAAVEAWLASHGQAVREPWYHGRPVLVTVNDYAAGVFNGDLGVAWREGPRVQVHFPQRGGAARRLSPSRLPHVETAWAMTVHKAQGSEFDDVLVVLPEYESRLLSRELLYTAVTRARKSVTLFASETAMRSALARSTGRTSGLARRLRELNQERPRVNV